MNEKLLESHQNITTLFIETTNLCNLQCSYCYNKSFSTEKNISLDVIIQTLDNLSAFHMHPHLVLSGGEYLYRKDFKEMLDVLIEKVPSITIATNGLLLNDKTIRFLEQKNNIFLQVSLDGITDEDNLYRGVKANVIISAIKKVLETNLRKHLSVRVTIHKQNYNNIEQIMLFCLENEIELRLSFICFSINKPETSKYLLNEDEIFCVFVKIKKFNNKHSSSFQLPDICVGGICGLMDNNGQLAIKIDVEGNIYACQAGQSENFLLGNITYISVYDSTTSKNLKNIRNKIILRKKILENKCNVCALTNDCLGRCVAHIENEEGSLYKCSDRYRFALERYLQC